MSSYHTVQPTGGARMRHVMDPSDPNVNLLEQILSRDNLRQAWKRLKANKGAPGIDKMSIDDFPEFARTHWESIRDSLFGGNCQPLPVKRVEIPKPTGGTRPLGIPSVVDRVIQQAIYQIMMPIFDPEFSEVSYGFQQQMRPNSSGSPSREPKSGGRTRPSANSNGGSKS